MAKRNTSSAEPEWVRISEAARRTGFCRATIWNWVVAGRLTFTQPGGPGTALLVDFTTLRAAFEAPHVATAAVKQVRRNR